MLWQYRDGKSEIRNPTSERTPRSEIRIGRRSAGSAKVLELGRDKPDFRSHLEKIAHGVPQAFGIRISDFGLLSPLGFRPSDFEPLHVMTISDLLQSVRRIEVRTNRLVNDMMVGAYLSHFKGRGMDFEELREYVPGDEVRDIDWNVTYRMGRPFVKRFREERELALVLAVDVSGSSAFGSLRRTKREFATEVAGTLAVSAARNSDKVGLLLFSDQVELYLPPRKGRRHILRLIREMLFFKPKHSGTNIAGGLAFLNHVLHRRSIVFLLTDFLHSFGASKSQSGIGQDRKSTRL